MTNPEEVWFWQRILTPHMGALAAALASQGVAVTFVANTHMTPDRERQGWITPELGQARLELAPTLKDLESLVFSAPGNSIHLCQGLRGNGLIGQAQRRIRQRGLRHWTIMETVDDAGWAGLIKRALYRGLFWHWRSTLEGVLAIGRDTPDWIVARGMPGSRVFPFAYFLREPETDAWLDTVAAVETSRAFRFIFVGRLIELKRVDVLIEALAELDRTDIELRVVGTGPLEASLQAQATQLLPGRVKWLGRQPMSAVPALIAEGDCLVLPSRHDGWGAVVSEALMVGTPVICSDACGSAEAVQASGVGGVFATGNIQALIAQLHQRVQAGPWPALERQRLADWAECLVARAGAEYLAQILLHGEDNHHRPEPPWKI